MEINEVQEKLENMHFDDIVKSYCNKVNDLEKEKAKTKELKEKLNDCTENYNHYVDKCFKLEDLNKEIQENLKKEIIKNDVLETRIEQLQAKLDELTTQLEEANNNYRIIVPIYEKAKSKIDELEKLHTLGLQALAESNNEKAQLQSRIDELEKGYEKIINYIEEDSEIAIPINELMREDGTRLTKKEYGLVLLKYLTIELRSKFLPNNPKTN